MSILFCHRVNNTQKSVFISCHMANIHGSVRISRSQISSLCGGLLNCCNRVCESLVKCRTFILELDLTSYFWWYTLIWNLFLGIGSLYELFISGLILHFHYNIWGLLITLMVAVGGGVTFICFLGCTCIVTKHSWMIILFALLAGSASLIGFGLGTYEFFKDNAIFKYATEWEFNEGMRKYREKDYNYIISEVQTELDCCGTRGATDWSKVFPDNRTSLPLSCCEDLPENSECTIELAHPQGCYDSLLSRIEESKVASLTRLISLLEMLSVISVICLYLPCLGDNLSNDDSDSSD